MKVKNVRIVALIMVFVLLLVNTNVTEAMYDVTSGRFTSRDPIVGEFEEPLTLHAYLYCMNDPVNMVDKTGKFVAVAAVPVVYAAVYAGILTYAMYKLTKAIDFRNYSINNLMEGMNKTNTFLADVSLRACVLTTMIIANQSTTLDDHIQKYKDAVEELKSLETQYNNSTGPKQKRPLKEKIEKLKKAIEGHLKEMRQKWNWEP